jgi:serine phosphatase RsbU (regulator of sigma subunit)
MGQRLEQEERERIEQELLVARSIQQASLPKEVPTLEGWQITPFYQPAREVGGDFYGFHLLSEDRLGVVVGDATGKEMFGTPHLRGVLSERPESERGLSATLMEELDRITGEGWEQEDGITLLTLRSSAASR